MFSLYIFCLVFISSNSLLNISCIFSVCASILLLRSWIIFTIITLNSFSSRLPISTSLSCSGVLSYFFIRNMFLCHLTLSNFLCGHCFSGCRSVISFAFGVCPLVDEVVPGACAGFLLGGTDACPLCMGMVLIPLIGKAISRVCLEAAAHSR